MKFAITALMLPALLSACATPHFNRLAVPDVVVYSPELQSRAADEIEGGSCPVLGETMMPDYSVMRDQARAAR